MYLRRAGPNADVTAAEVIAAEVFAPAKINFFLEILGRRSDGYHELVTLMVAVRLFDRLRLTPMVDPAIRLRIGLPLAESTPAEIPTDERNTVVRALQRLRQIAGVEGGMEVQLTKRIPSEAGLGGASSDAAAALFAANQLWRLNYSRQRLSEIAAEIGSDVPFFLHGPAAVCRGRGEIIQPLPAAAPLPIVIVKPPVGLSTAEVYRHCRAGEPPRDGGTAIAAWREQSPRKLAAAMFNRLQAAAAEASPEVDRTRRLLAALDFRAAQMSGSGSSFFAVCPTPRHARRAAVQLRSRGAGWTCVTTTVGRQQT